MQRPARCGRAEWFLPVRMVAPLCAILLLAGCQRFFEDHSRQALDTADKKYLDGDYPGAVQYYEDALDGTPATAEVHYKMALLFDDKLQNPLAAMYHFQRYLDLKPNGPHAREANGFMKEDQMKLVATFSHGALMSQEDAARLKNDNLILRQKLSELQSAPRTSSPQDSTPQHPGSAVPADQPAPGSHSYEVQAGDTLASIARKFYKNSARWQDIERANYSKLKGSSKLKPGMTLIIPK